MRPQFEDVDPNAAPFAVLKADATATLEELRAEARHAAQRSSRGLNRAPYAADWRDFLGLLRVHRPR